MPWDSINVNYNGTNRGLTHITESILEMAAADTNLRAINIH